MVKVCDSIMGSGKSQAAIRFMNEHPDIKFVYITPYVDEAARIKRDCPDLRFVEPSKTLPEYGFSKTNHTAALLSRGANIATTHAAFRMYTEEMAQVIRNQGYTLIVDEAVEVFQEPKCSDGDIQMLIDAGYIAFTDGVYSDTGKPYTGKRLKDLFRLLSSNNLVRLDPEKQGGKERMYYWTLTPNTLRAFRDVYVLTYMFECQDLRCCLDINGIGYEYIGVKKSECGEYRFTDSYCQIPKHVVAPTEKIHIYGNEKLNAVGKAFHDISANWFNRARKDGVVRLKKNLRNFFLYYCKDVPSDKFMWGTYKDDAKHLRAKGFMNKHVNFNMKAVNNYGDRTALAYCANVFLSPVKKNYFAKYGIELDGDMYALSIMLQWIWRSAIRNGQDILIYIPSRRMRTLLTKWINETNNGGNTYE